MKKIIYILLLILLLTGCKAKTYTVTFVDNDKVLSNVSVTKGDNLKGIGSPEKEGYIFVSWLKDGFSYDLDNPITEDITLTASWTEEPTIEKKYTVTFDFGEYKKTQTIKEGKRAIPPEHNPKKEKHTFLGWYLDDKVYDFSTPVTSDMTIKAKYEKNRVSVTYDLNGGTGSTVQVEISKGTIPDKPKSPTKFGYTFSGWTIDGKAYNFEYQLNDDVTILANWEPIVYIKVTFDTDGGNNIPSKMIPQGSNLSVLSIPEKEGYTFKYWSLNGSEFDINSKINTNITLLAIYEEDKTDN